MRGQSCGWGSIGTEDLLARYCDHLDLPPNFYGICGDVIRLPVASALLTVGALFRLLEVSSTLHAYMQPFRTVKVHEGDQPSGS